MSNRGWTDVGRALEDLSASIRSHLSPPPATGPTIHTSAPGPIPDGPDMTAPPHPAESAPWADPTTASPDPAGTTGPVSGTTGPAAGTTGSTAGPTTGATGPTTGGARPAGGTAGPRARGGGAAGGAGGAGDAWAAATAAQGPVHHTPPPEQDEPPRWGGPKQGWGADRGGRAGDWASARESVRTAGESARRLYDRAGDAARDPDVRDSVARAARTLGDAISGSVEEFQRRLRNPRWNDPSVRPERPPVAPDDEETR